MSIRSHNKLDSNISSTTIVSLNGIRGSRIYLRSKIVTGSKVAGKRRMKTIRTSRTITDTTTTPRGIIVLVGINEESSIFTSRVGKTGHPIDSIKAVIRENKTVRIVEIGTGDRSRSRRVITWVSPVTGNGNKIATISSINIGIVS